ncbi:MAG: hypothetical protein LQ338_003094 [Usnochroma carphineum]|nr:MAG: hypothetical protein LQ338_003094 [Usnochroma carphineum]
MGDTPGTLYAIAIVFSLLAVAATVLRFYARSIKKERQLVIWVGIPQLGNKKFKGESSLSPSSHTAPKCFNRIFQGRWIQNAVWFMVGIDFIWIVGFFFSNLLQCYPISVNWTGIGNIDGYCVNTNMLVYAQSWSDIATDAIPKSILTQLIGDRTVASSIAKLAIFSNIIHRKFEESGSVVYLDLQTPLVYWPMVESAVGILGACLPLLRPLFAGAASRGFMRDLQSVDIPTSERSETLWDRSGNSGATGGWDSNASTVRWGSDSLPAGEVLREKRLPSLPQASLAMLRDAPDEGPWMKQPVVHVEMV